MALPSLASAKYNLTLPSTGEKVEYRPFLVKEEKILMIAQSSGDDKDMIRAVEDIVESCTFGKVKARDLPFFDLEYVFIQLRAKSVGETATITVTCQDDEKVTVPVEIDLTKLKCEPLKDHNAKIELTDEIGIIMEYPKLSTISKVDGEGAEVAFDIIKASVKEIYDADNVYARNDMDEKDLDAFIDSMTHTQFEKVQKFFDTMPRVRHTIKVKNPNTDVETKIDLEGMAAFF